MSVASSSPSPSPTPSPAQSSPSHFIHPQSTKPGALVSSAKSILSEQNARLLMKHNTDLDLLEDLRVYFKNRFALERDYAQSLAKLNITYAKRTSTTFLAFVNTEDEHSEIKSLYTSWRIYQEEMERQAKSRLAQFEQMASIGETLKTMRSHKVQVAKKCLDNYLKKMHEELISSVNEIDKTRKLYFEEEHLAKQARDKEEKIKKRKTGIFASFTSLQNKKERTSAHREASDIQSTQARNDYIMALAAGNAHLTHYYNQDLVNLMINIDDTMLDKCRTYMLNLLKMEKESATLWWDVIERSIEMVEKTSSDYTNSLYYRDPNSSPFNEMLVYEFQACDNDPIDTISLEHNADIALRNEGQKWFTWFSKECRNLNRLSAQLVKMQSLLCEGQKTVDLPGSGQVDVENRIDEIRQQLRKCEISKLKAKARLQVIKDSGAEVEDFESFESQVASEIKQQLLDVDNMKIEALSRTPSMRFQSDTESRSPKMDSESAVRPESSSSIEQLDSPDREVLQMGASVESTSPGPTSMTYTDANQSWANINYDPMAAWNDDPVSATNYEENHQPINETTFVQTKIADVGQEPGQQNYEQEQQQPQQYDNYEQTVDAFSLVGKKCQALYAYTAQNNDELSIQELDILTVVHAEDQYWVQAKDKNEVYGYVPASYLIALPEQDVNVQNDTIDTDWPMDEVPQGQPSPLKFDENSVWNNHDNAIGNTNEFIPEQHPAILTPPPEVKDDDYEEERKEKVEEEEDEENEERTEFYVRALYDFDASNDEEISFKAEELIKIIDKESDDGWWTGINAQGQRGHFPSMLVYALEENDEDDDKMNDDSEENDHTNFDSDNENDLVNDDIDEVGKVAMPPVPPLPPLPAPTITSPDNNGKTVEPGTGVPLPIVEPTIIDETIINGNGIAAAAPKTMNLMAPQSVVIIQPTPEIEFRPTIGSDQKETGLTASLTKNSINNQTGNNLEKKKKFTDNNNNNNNSSSSINRIEQNIGVSMAIAVHEISETIAQQTLDDSLKEFERRQSSSSNSSTFIDVNSGANTSVSNNENAMLNNSINDNNNNDNGDEEEEEDNDDDDVK